MIDTFSFYKKDDGTWWVDYPDWTDNGYSPLDLQMVAGADTMLDFLSERGRNIFLKLTDEEKRGKSMDHKMYHEGDGNYDFNGHKLWLCHVTEYIFGDYPDVIYFKIV